MDTARVGHSMFWSFVQHWGARLITFAVFFVLARLLEPTDFGVIALAGVLLAFAEVLIEAGFADALVVLANLVLLTNIKECSKVIILCFGDTCLLK